MSADPAAPRFFAIQMARVGGVLLTIYALLAVDGSAPWPEGMPVELAYILLPIGLAVAFVVPQAMVRRWRTPG